MADAVTLQSMILECRRASNQETADESQALCTDAEIRRRLNSALRLVYTKLVRARGAQYFRASSSISTVAGTAEYALPAAMMQLVGVELLRSTSDRVPLTEIQEPERYEWENVTGAQEPARYQLRGQSIALLPTPASARTVNLYYVPSFVPLANLTDTFDGVCGWEEAAIWTVAAEMIQKDGEDPSYALSRAGQWSEEIDELAEQRDAARPMRVQRIRRQRRQDWWLR